MAGEPRRFEIVSAVGHTSQGRTYLAREVAGGGLVRLWVPEVDLDEAPEQQALLASESELLASLHHPSIASTSLVQLHGVWTLVQAARLDENLRALQARLAIPSRAAITIVAAVADALHAAYHSKTEEGGSVRLLHGDLRAASVRLGSDGQVVVSGYGLPRDPDLSGEAGCYAAPEVLMGNRGPKSDVYSLGILVLQLLTGANLGPTSKHAGQHEGRVGYGLAKLASVRGLEDDGGLQDLLNDMLAFESYMRPGTREVARSLLALEESLEGASLSEWASEVIAREEPVTLAGDDELVGKLLAESAGGVAQGTPYERLIVGALSFAPLQEAPNHEDADEEDSELDSKISVQLLFDEKPSQEDLSDVTADTAALPIDAAVLAMGAATAGMLADDAILEEEVDDAEEDSEAAVRIEQTPSAEAPADDAVVAETSEDAEQEGPALAEAPPDEQAASGESVSEEEPPVAGDEQQAAAVEEGAPEPEATEERQAAGADSEAAEEDSADEEQASGEQPPSAEKDASEEASEDASVAEEDARAAEDAASEEGEVAEEDAPAAAPEEAPEVGEAAEAASPVAEAAELVEEDARVAEDDASEAAPEVDEEAPPVAEEGEVAEEAAPEEAPEAGEVAEDSAPVAGVAAAASVVEPGEEDAPVAEEGTSEAALEPAAPSEEGSDELEDDFFSEEAPKPAAPADEGGDELEDDFFSEEVPDDESAAVLAPQGSQAWPEDDDEVVLAGANPSGLLPVVLLLLPLLAIPLWPAAPVGDAVATAAGSHPSSASHAPASQPSPSPTVGVKADGGDSDAVPGAAGSETTEEVAAADGEAEEPSGDEDGVTPEGGTPDAAENPVGTDNPAVGTDNPVAEPSGPAELAATAEPAQPVAPAEPVAPVSAPAPKPSPKPPNVMVAGDVSRVVLVSNGRRISLPGRLLAGDYAVEADFGDGMKPAGTITVPKSGAITVRCDTMFALCRAN